MDMDRRLHCENTTSQNAMLWPEKLHTLDY